MRYSGLPTGVGGRLEGMEAGIAFFIRRWASSPYRIGGIMPSARPLARAMACASMEARRGEGPVVELGGRTGSITQALIERGIGEQDVDSSSNGIREMCRWLIGGKAVRTRRRVVQPDEAASRSSVILARREPRSPQRTCRVVWSRSGSCFASMPSKQVIVLDMRSAPSRASMRCLKAEHLCRYGLCAAISAAPRMCTRWVSSAVRPAFCER